MTVSSGHVVVGSSAIALDATGTRSGAADVSVTAPRVDLADFNDFFDTGDTFAGAGSLALQAATSGTRVIATSGDARFAGVRFQRMELGTVAARWSSRGGAVATSLRFGGASGEVALNGTIAPKSRSVNLRADARQVDLAMWLPMLGYDVPITGKLDAQTTLAGTYPDIAMRVHAAVFGGTAGRMTIQRFEISASAAHGRGTIESAALDVPGMSTTASGTFGLRENDPLALAITSTSANVGAVVTEATGRDYGASARFSSQLYVEGTRAAPRLRDIVALQNVQYRGVTVPRVAGEIDADRQSLALRNGEVDLVHGKALIAAAKRGNDVSGSMVADDVELSNVAALLPKGSHVSGRLDGRVDAGGSLTAPQIHGAMTLADGAFDGPMETTPITGIAGSLSFTGTQARLDSHAFAGGGR